LLFLPFLPVLLGVGFGVVAREWRLVTRSLGALATETVLAVVAGAAVASATPGPLQFAEFSPLLTGLVLSLIVGASAGFATTDDVGWRQLVGLAAASQMAFVPVWLGSALVYGFSGDGAVAPSERLLTCVVNTLAIVASAAASYAALGMARHRFPWRAGGARPRRASADRQPT
jgi:hypothetical protein